MPTDSAAILEIAQAIGRFAHDLVNEDSSLNHTTRAELVRNAERLAIAVREPEENLYFQATQVGLPQGPILNFAECILTASVIQTAQNSALRTAIGMGVFDNIPPSNTGISATDLSAAINVDERLLGQFKYTSTLIC